MSVPIQQLQFQPILIVSTLPGSHNAAAPSGASTNRGGLSQTVASATVGNATATTTADRTLDNTESYGDSAPLDSGACSNLKSTTAQRTVSTESNSASSHTHLNTTVETRTPTAVSENHPAGSNFVRQPVENGDSREKGDLPVATEKGGQNREDVDSTASADGAIIFNGSRSNSSIADATDNHTGVSNGFLEDKTEK